MKKLVLLLTALLLCFAVPVLATPSLSWTASDLGSGRWQYDYSITNDLPGQSIDTFSVDFAYGLYDNLTVEALPAGWSSSFAYSPAYLSSIGPIDGALWGISDPGGAIMPGTTLGVFAVSFDWLLGDINPDTGALLSPPLDSAAGIRTDGDQNFAYSLTPSAPVPEPGTFLLLSLGLGGAAALVGFRRNREHV
jgi:hypothetical protein